MNTTGIDVQRDGVSMVVNLHIEADEWIDSVDVITESLDLHTDIHTAAYILRELRRFAMNPQATFATDSDTPNLLRILPSDDLKKLVETIKRCSPGTIYLSRREVEEGDGLTDQQREKLNGAFGWIHIERDKDTGATWICSNKTGARIELGPTDASFLVAALTDFDPPSN